MQVQTAEGTVQVPSKAERMARKAERAARSAQRAQVHVRPSNEGKLQEMRADKPATNVRKHEKKSSNGKPRSAAPKAIDGLTFNSRQLYFVAATGKWGYYDARNQFTLTEYRDVPGEEHRGKPVFMNMQQVKGYFPRNVFVPLNSTRDQLRIAGEFDSSLRYSGYGRGRRYDYGQRA